MKRVQSLLTKGALLAIGVVACTSSMRAEVDNRSLLTLVGPSTASSLFLEGRTLDGRNGSELYLHNYGNVVNTTFNPSEIRWSNCGNYFAVGGVDSNDTAPAGGSSINLRVYEFYDKAGDLSSFPPGITEITGAREGTPTTVNSISWAPSTKFLASGEIVGTVRVYDFDGTDLSTPSTFGHGAAVNSVDYHPSGTQLAIGGDIGDPNGGAPPPSANVRVLSVSASGTISTTEVASTTLGATVQSVAWSPDGKFLAIGGDAGGAQVQVLPWDGTSFGTAITFSHGEDINEVDWSPNGKFLAIGGATGTGTRQVRVLPFDGSSFGTPINALDHGATINSVSWYPDGKNLAIAGANGTGNFKVRSFPFDGNSLQFPTFSFAFGVLVNSVHMRPANRFDTNLAISNCHKLLVNDICPIAADSCQAAENGTTRFSGNVTVAEDKTLCADKIQGTTVCTDEIVTEKITCTLNANPQVLVGGITGTDGKELRILDGDDGTQVRDGDSLTFTVNSTKYSPSGAFIASGDTDGILRIYANDLDSTDLNPFLASFDQGDTIRSVDWSPDGAYVAIGSDTAMAAGGFEVRVIPWDGTSLGTPITFDNPSLSVNEVSFAPDGNYLAIGSIGSSDQVKILAFDGATLTSVANFTH